MNSKILIIISAVVLVIVLGSALLLNKSIKTTTTNTTVNNTRTTTTRQSQTANNNTSVGVTVTADGFEPKDLKIKIGITVVWANKSGKNVSVNSDVYPNNLLWPFLNLGAFNDGQNVSVVFDKSGKYTYHNQFIPGQTGSITVE